MLLPALLLFSLFLVMSAFFSASETAFIASNPYTLESLEKKGSRRAALVKNVHRRLNDLLATILIGNTLVNTASASLATFIFVSFIPNKNQAVLLATAATTVLILIFGEINPKTYAAHNPLRTTFFLIHPLRLVMFLLFPLVKAFSFLTGLILPSSRGQSGGIPHHLNEEEIKILLASGAKGLSALRSKMITGILDIGSRPVKEIMVPRPQVKAIEAESSLDQIIKTIQESGYSRYPVYRGRMDNLEGLLHAKDVVPYLVDNKEFIIKSVLRRPFFVPELASLEKVLLQMQENAVHLAFVVDEFGSLEGIVTLEDILEEVVGEIQDEYDGAVEDWLSRVDERTYLVKGSAPVKTANARLGLKIPEKGDYTTLAGFLLYEFGRIPREKESLDIRGNRYTVEKMNKRHISLIRVEVGLGERTPSE